MRGFFRAGALAAAAVLLAVLALCACSPEASGLESMVAGNGAPSPAPGGEPSTGAELALIATASRLESADGQGVWNTISRFAGENGYTSDYYVAEQDDGAAALATLELAARGGAVLVVTMDEAVSAAVSGATSAHPGARFVLLDAAVDYAPPPACVALGFSAVQAGWLAGYVAAYEESALGLLQAADDDRAAAYALGFALGAEYAAEEQQKPPGSVRLAFSDPRDGFGGTAARRAAELFGGGAGLVYAAVPPARQGEVMDAAQQAGGKLIGPWPDLTGTGTSVLAGTAFDPKALLYAVLEDWRDGAFPAGRRLEGAVEDGSVRLVADAGRFTNARAWILDQPALRFEGGALAARLSEALQSGEGGGIPFVDELDLTYLVVTPPVLPEPEEEPLPGQSTGEDPAPVAETVSAPPETLPESGA